MKKAVVLSTDGTVRSIDIDPSNELTQLQSLVGGYIQAVTLPNGVTMWLNEEGKLHGLEHNSSAQRLFDRSFGAGYDLIVGDAVLMGGADEEGDTLGLTEEQVALYTYALSAQ